MKKNNKKETLKRKKKIKKKKKIKQKNKVVLPGTSSETRMKMIRYVRMRCDRVHFMIARRIQNSKTINAGLTHHPAAFIAPFLHHRFDVCDATLHARTYLRASSSRKLESTLSLVENQSKNTAYRAFPWSQPFFSSRIYRLLFVKRAPIVPMLS